MKYVITMDMLIFVEGVEVEIEGKKAKRDKGSIELRIGAYIDKNEEMWAKLPFLRRIYDRYLINKRIEAMEGELYEEAHGLIEEIKAFLELHTHEK